MNAWYLKECFVSRRRGTRLFI